MANKVLQLHPSLNIPYEVEATVVSAGAGNAGAVVGLDASGKIDVSVLPTGIGADVAVIIATENLAAGDLVNIYDATGPRVRKADASAANAGRIAHGFVKASVASSASATVYFEGSNDQMSALVPGTTYALSSTTPGKVTALASATTTAGHSLQVVGVATAATVLNVEFAKPIIRS